MCIEYHKDPSYHNNFIIKGFIETSFVDWPGSICSVLFLPNCNFRCSYCHNADLVLHPETMENVSLNSVVASLRRHKGWIDGVCVSGGEPTIHPVLSRLLSVIKKEGFLTKLDTNGSRPEVLQSLIQDGLVDYIAMDIKAPLAEEAYCRVIGVHGFMDEVKKSIDIIRRGSVAYEFRCTVIPSFHLPQDIFRVAEELCGSAKLKLQNFNPAHTLDPLLHTSSSYSYEDLSIYQQRVDQIISQQVH